MNLWITQRCPPGSNGKTQFLSFLVFSLFFTANLVCNYGREYHLNYQALFVKELGQRVLRPQAVMPDFVSLYDPILPYIAFVAFFALIEAVFFYASYYQGSRSIYLMKRLPNPQEHWRLCLTLPALSMLLFVLLLGVTLLFTYVFYLLFTPAAALTPQQGQKFWTHVFRMIPIW